ncbi:hypothetical protein HYV84_03230 [Candidatus Woesearchaeota archaeon]|nr:hypothetical protein [Candidatus Woesearchaeota archaeon]
MLYIVEHLEDELHPWCIIEYRHITKIVGKKNVLFTHVRFKKDCDKIRGFAKAIPESFTALGLKKVCVLDPAAKIQLSPKDKEEFSVVVLGGILGNNPPRERTKLLIPESIVAGRRNIGNGQMPTDNAAFVAKEILEGGRELSDIPFQDGVEVVLGDGESNVLPYRYVLVKGKPLMSGELIGYLKKHGGF